MLARHGNYAEAAELLDLAREMNTEKATTLLNRRDYAEEIARLRRMVDEELATSAAPPSPPEPH